MQTEFSSWIEDYVAFGLALADRVLGIDRLVSHFQIEHLPDQPSAIDSRREGILRENRCVAAQPKEKPFPKMENGTMPLPT
ncbi:MAG: hypothetical protein DI553_00455 [Cutibacterium acnes]|nr:MAG: hypothetical protein DI553_00455 [Cutibacterium acnes]